MATKKSTPVKISNPEITYQFMEMLFKLGHITDLEFSILVSLSVGEKTMTEIAEGLGLKNKMWLVGKTAKKAREKVYESFGKIRIEASMFDSIRRDTNRLLAEVKYFRLLKNHKFTEELITLLATPIKDMTPASHGLSEMAKNAILRTAGRNATFVDAISYSREEYSIIRGNGKGTIEKIGAFFTKYDCSFKENIGV